MRLRACARARPCVRLRTCARTLRELPTVLLTETDVLDADWLSHTVPALLMVLRMTPSSVSVERLWALGDGTICLLVDRGDAPRYEVCVVRGDHVLRENRLYARGTAQMLAETWRVTLASMRAERAEQQAIDSVHLASA